MGIKVVTSLGTLMKLASDLGKARQKGDLAEIEEAQRKHDEYKKICLEADEMHTGQTYGSLFGR
jgi:hypothetical protein